MNVLLKNLGVLLLLIGVAILAVPALTGGMTNGLLIGGLVTILVGYICHIFLNKKIG